MKAIVVCEHCGNHDKDASIEMNFREKTIYYYCSQCKKENKLDLSSRKDATPLPRIKIRR